MTAPAKIAASDSVIARLPPMSIRRRPIRRPSRNSASSAASVAAMAGILAENSPVSTSRSSGISHVRSTVTSTAAPAAVPAAASIVRFSASMIRRCVRSVAIVSFPHRPGGHADGRYFFAAHRI